jgi:hypothetical protein
VGQGTKENMQEICFAERSLSMFGVICGKEDEYGHEEYRLYWYGHYGRGYGGAFAGGGI